MKTDTITIAIVALAIVLILIWIYSMESFATKREKADAVSKWYKDGGRSYKSFRQNIPTGDILEYTDSKRILLNNKANASDLLSAIYTP